MAVERDERPWGFYEVVDSGAGFRVKRICVKPGQRLSYQRHRKRSENWFFVGGSGTVTLNGAVTPVSVGTTFEVPVGAAHRVQNTGLDDLVFIEVQTGNYFGEDDIERIEDDYGRHGEVETRARLET